MSTLIHEQRDDRVVLRRLRRMQRLRRRRQRRKDEMVKRALEILGWLTAVFIFLYASHAAFAQTPEVTAGEAPLVEPPRLAREEQEAEEAEARELVGRAVARLRETEDVSSLFEEMFVRDFAARLRADARGYPFDDVVLPSVVAQASDEELRRAHAAVTNSLLASARHASLRVALREASGVDDRNGEGELKSVLEQVLRDEPALVRILGLKPGAGAGEDGGDFTMTANTVAQMRAMTALFEKMAGVIRSRARSLEERLAAFGVPAEEWRGEAKVEEVTPDVFYGDRFGFRAGERNVRADVEVYPDVKLRLTLVREGERLKMLSAEPLLDSE